MKIRLDNKFNAFPNKTILGYVGETNARTITFSGLSVSGANSYSMIIDYGDGEKYEVNIVDGIYTVDASVLKRPGLVNCQVLAKALSEDGATYTIVKKSNIFALNIGKSIDPGAIPTYEQATSAVEKLIQINPNANDVLNFTAQIDQNVDDIAELSGSVEELKGDLVYSIGEEYNEITELSWEEGYYVNRYGYKLNDSQGQISVINVKAGERYHLIGYNAYHLSLYCLYETLYNRTKMVVYPKEPDDTDFSKRLLDVYIEIPEGYNYLVISQWIAHNLENFHLYKYGIKDLKNVKSDIAEVKSDIAEVKSDIAEVKSDKFEYNNITSCIIENQIKNDFAWKEFDGLYATITFDDTNTDIDQLQDLAEELGIPFCYATIPSRLGNIMSQGTETAKQVLERAVANGGEVLSHWGSPLNSLSTDEDYYNVYVGAKKALTENGFEVNGIITAGGGAEGTPQSFKTQNFLKDIELARIYYKYADLTANNFVPGQDLRYIEQFYNSRTFTDGGVNFMKSKIDAMVSQGSGWLNMASHGTNHPNTPSIDSFRQIFQYAIDNGFTFVTWGEMYDKFKSSKLEERIKALELN